MKMNVYSLSAGALLTFMLFVYGMAGWTNVEPGEYAILVKQFGEDKGVQEKGLSVGTHWVEPISNDVVTYDTKAHQYPMTVRASTKDGQPVEVGMTLEISLEHSGVKDLHQLIGRDYYNQVVSPAAGSAIKDSLPTQLSDTVYTDEGRSFIRRSIYDALNEKNVGSRGINVSVNLQSIEFLNQGFIDILEQKASAAQLEEIQRRKAAAAEQEAIKVANIAEGQKQKRIKEAEANKEELRLQGEGQRLQNEQQALGILAIKEAEAEGQKLLVEAYGSMGAEAVVGIAWAENLGPNVKVYGVPTGAPGTTSIMDINKVIQGAFTGSK